MPVDGMPRPPDGCKRGLCDSEPPETSFRSAGLNSARAGRIGRGANFCRRAKNVGPIAAEPPSAHHQTRRGSTRQRRASSDPGALSPSRCGGGLPSSVHQCSNGPSEGELRIGSGTLKSAMAQSGAGWRPRNVSSSRIARTSGRFRRSAEMVARPVGVRPATVAPFH